jgi:hypothetical protein
VQAIDKETHTGSWKDISLRLTCLAVTVDTLQRQISRHIEKRRLDAARKLLDSLMLALGRLLKVSYAPLRSS